MRGQLWRQVGANRLQFIVSVRRCKVEEHRSDPVQQLPRFFHGNDGVIERSIRALRGDGLHFGQLFRHASLERRQVMLGCYLAKWRVAEFQLTVIEERVAHDGL